MDAAAAKLKKEPLKMPAAVFLTEHDSVVDTQKLIGLLSKAFPNPATRIVWYGAPPTELVNDPRVLNRTDYLPEKKIASFAHMSLTFSPQNPWYGQQGKYRMCRNSLSQDDYQKCQTSEQVWYSAWGQAPKDKISARLTFNPYYEWQLGVIDSVLDAALTQARVKEHVETIKK